MNTLIKSIKQLIHSPLLYVIISYLILNLINLTKLPIFNDEAIYLDWAWAHTHYPGHLFYSLLDAKQPLSIWIFSVFENIFADPLLGGRFASVLIGSISLVGIYEVGKIAINKQVGLIATIIYAITPIFVFYNRQALMEPLVSTVGIWTFVYLLKILKKFEIKNLFILGAILGLGFLTKFSSLIFALSATVELTYQSWKTKSLTPIKYLFTIYGVFLSFAIILFINPQFWQSLSSNVRFTFSFSELLAIPLKAWSNNLGSYIEILFFFLTPPIFISILIGTFYLIKTKIENGGTLLRYILVSSFLVILLTRNINQRYIVSFFPILLIPSSYAIHYLWGKSSLWKIIITISIGLTSIVSLMQIYDPAKYIATMNKFSGHSDTEYIYGQTSGYGIREAMSYVKGHANLGQPNLVLFALNSGNPENAMDVYSILTKNLYPMHLDAKILPGIEKYECLTSQYPTYFITRNNETGGMGKFFDLEKSFKNPYSEYAVNIYTLKKNCSGLTGSLSDYYLDTMKEIHRIRNYQR